MERCCAPSYTKLYLEGWEHELFLDTPLSMYLCHILQWHRYIDDVLLTWMSTPTELTQYMQALGFSMFNLKFTMTYNTIFVNGMVATTLCRKPTAGNTILHADSADSQAIIF